MLINDNKHLRVLSIAITRFMYLKKSLRMLKRLNKRVKYLDENVGNCGHNLPLYWPNKHSTVNKTCPITSWTHFSVCIKGVKSIEQGFFF